MALIDNVRRLSEQVTKRLPNVKNEEATKNALILPFLGALGYDIFDPGEVQPEFVADFAKKRTSGQAEKVDYAIHLNGMPVMFFECKAAGADPTQHSGQLKRYFNTTPSVKVGIVTNGVRYLFYTDLEEQNMMSERPFFDFNILEFTDRDVETLESFTRANFDATTVRGRAEDIIFTDKVSTYVNDLLRNPTEAFTRFVLGELDLQTGKLTAKRVEKFVPIVRKAIQSTLLDMATRSIKQETEESSSAAALTPAAQVTSSASPAMVPEAPREQSKGIVTTQEELDAFDLVKRVCSDSPVAAKYPIQYRDSVNYFGINIGNFKKWFLRLFFDGRRKAVVTRIAQDRAALLAPGFEVEAPPENVGKSRVFISGLKDLDRLRPLVLHAYEEEVRRSESGADEEEPAASGT